MQRFLEYVLFNEAINRQLAIAQLTKSWQRKRVNQQEIENRINNIDPIIKIIADADPTPNKEFFAWLLTQYANDKVNLPEDNAILHQDLAFYATIKKNGILRRFQNNAKQTLNWSKKNPMDLTTLERSDLYDLIDYIKKETEGDLDSNRQKAVIAKQEGAKTLYQDEEWTLIEITKGQAACYYGKGTKWCTGSDVDTAERYLRDAPLYIVQHKGKPYCQIHFPEQQIMNPKDQEIDDMPDEIGEIIVNNIPNLSEEDKMFIYQHCDTDGELYKNTVEAKKDEIKEFVKEEEKKFRKELSLYIDWSDFGHKDYYGITASVSFDFDSNYLLVNPAELDSNYKLKRDLRDKVHIECTDYPYISEYNGELTISYDLDVYGHDMYYRDSFVHVKAIISSLLSYNDDDDYNRLKHDVYEILVDNEILENRYKEEEQEDYKYFEFDSDEFNRRGDIRFETKHYYTICSFDDIKLSVDLTPRGLMTNVKLKGNSDKVADVFEKYIRTQAIKQLSRHQKQGWIPFPDAPKPRLPFESFHHAPKINVNIFANIREKIVKLNLIIELNLHQSDDRELKAFKSKMKFLDQHFPEALQEAKKLIIQLGPTFTS